MSRFLGTPGLLALRATASWAVAEDFAGMRGADYVPSYARNDVQIWMDFGTLHYHNTADRPIPTLRWEAMRDGIDDVRYL